MPCQPGKTNPHHLPLHWTCPMTDDWQLPVHCHLVVQVDAQPEYHENSMTIAPPTDPACSPPYSAPAAPNHVAATPPVRQTTTTPLLLHRVRMQWRFCGVGCGHQGAAVMLLGLWFHRQQTTAPLLLHHQMHPPLLPQLQGRVEMLQAAWRMMHLSPEPGVAHWRRWSGAAGRCARFLAAQQGMVLCCVASNTRQPCVACLFHECLWCD